MDLKIDTGRYSVSRKRIMNRKINAVLIFVMGLGVFLAAFAILNPMPRLHPTKDSAINATYSAPFGKGFGFVSLQEISEVTIDLREPQKGPKITGKAHIRRLSSSKAESAQVVAEDADPMVGLGLGQFSTQAARDYHAVPYHNRVPNVQYVKAECVLCQK
jgi:hypothetical protein